MWNTCSVRLRAPSRWVVTSMPIVKPISGHTGCGGIFRYLTKGGRALAQDMVNLEWSPEHPCGYTNWAEEMDFTRVAFGNHRPWKGKPARTYKHYVVSPDPTDEVTLEALRELARAWVAENFPGFQAAIVYHDDNENGVMHAHVVVNNTNLQTGLRLQDPDPKELMRSVQRLAAERGMSFFADESREDVAHVAFGGTPKRERVYFRRAESELAEKGEYSWVADIRSRVAVARRAARDEPDFLGLLHELGVDVRDARQRGGHADWVYSVAGHETWQIRGENLGTAFGRESICQELVLRSAPNREDLLRDIARNAVAVGDYEELQRLASTLDVQEREGIRSLDDYELRIGALEAAGDFAGMEQMAGMRDYAAARKLLPQHAHHRSRRRVVANDDFVAATKRGAVRPPEQSQQSSAGRDKQRHER